MNVFYKVTQSLYEELKLAGFRAIKLGSIYEADLERQTIFPYAVIIPQTSTLSDNVDLLTIMVVGMDLVDHTKEELRKQEDPFFGIDNAQDVFNDVYNRLAIVAENYRRGDASDLLFQLEGDPTLDIFDHRFENLLYGFELTMTFKIPSEICP